MKKIILLSSYLLLAASFSYAQKTEGVWQEGKFSKKAVPDAKMELLTEAEPDTTKGFVPLFNQTGDDAQVLGGTAKFEWVDGELVGTSTLDSPRNSWYCTKKDYKGNMIITFYWKWGNDIQGNSGMMLRAGINKRQWLDGIQVEIEQDPNRGWTAGIYGEGVFKWQYSLSREEHDAARKAGANLYEWNKMTVMYKDGYVKTWSNGVPCANLKWNTDLDTERRQLNDTDVIGFQVHFNKKIEGSQIKFKDIMIKEL
ncbi:MAG: DUF1080 domain-containing protein [Opitutales bacterium]